MATDRIYARNAHWLGKILQSAIETKFLYPLIFTQSIVCNLLKIMAKFIFVKSKRRVLFLAAEIDFFEQNCVRALEPSLKGHSQLWDRATLDTSFLTLKKGYFNPKSKLRVEYIYKSASIFAVFCAIFNRSLKNRF